MNVLDQIAAHLGLLIVGLVVIFTGVSIHQWKRYPQFRDGAEFKAVMYRESWMIAGPLLTILFLYIVFVA